MKKIIVFMLAGAMLVTSFGCGTKQTADTGEDTTAEVTSAEDTAEADTIEAEKADDTSDATEERDPVTAEDALDENGFFKGVKASDIVTLPEYKGITVEGKYYIASEEDVQAQIDGVLESYTTYEQITDRAVEDGDTVNIDYIGSVDGVEFDGGNTGGNGTEVTIGVTNYIDDFLNQLIGHKPGETFNVEVTFPEDYGVDNLNGKDAVFVTTINYISEAVEAELTDEIADDHGFENKDALVADVEAWVVKSQLHAVATQIMAQAEVGNVPEIVMQYLEDGELASIENMAAMYGMTADTVLMIYGYESKDAYIKEVTTLWLTAQAIAEKEGLTVSDELIEEKGFTEEEIATYGLPYVKQYLITTEVVPSFIIENAVQGE